MIAEIIGGLMVLLVGTWIMMTVEGRKRAKDAQRGVFVGALRVMSGKQRGVSAQWLVGEWEIRSGMMSMDPVSVPIMEIVAGSRRPAKLKEIVFGGDTIVITVRTETALLEWSMLRRFDELALQALGVPESNAAPSAEVECPSPS